MLALKLKLVLENLFLKTLEAMLDLIDVINVDCTRTGLKLQAIDTDDITIVELFISVEDFKDYYLYDEDFSVSISIDDLVKAIRCADEGDTITIKVDDEYFDTIALSLETPKGDTTFNVRVVDADHLFYIPDWMVLDSNYEAIVQMPSAEFMRVCKYLSDKGSDGHISVTEDGLMFSTYAKYGDVNGRYTKTEKATTATGVTYNMQAPVSLTLDLKYMYNIAKVSALLGQVKISLSTMYPLMIECKMGKMSYMRYFLAPKGRREEMSHEENEWSAAEKEGSAEDKGSKQ